MYNIRVRFVRGQEVKFISHLDLMKVFERAIRRSGLPIAYSQGFNPHPQMVFGLPLSVGVTSEGEYADFELVREMKPELFMETLNRSLPQGVHIIGAAEKKARTNIMAVISGADYTIDVFLNDTMTPRTAAEKLDQLLGMNSVKVLKEGKGAAKEVDIRPMILEAKLEEMKELPSGYEKFASAFTVSARFRAGSVSNLRPELFVAALVEHAGIPVTVSRFHRKALFIEKDGKMLDPLDKVNLE